MPRPARTQSRVRLNLDLPEETKQRLEGLRDITHADSMSEVVRRALAVYEFLLEEKTDGGVTIMRSRDGTERQLKIL